ncbi:hypothetical protein ACLOJK_038451 [Asimina triloba]
MDSYYTVLHPWSNTREQDFRVNDERKKTSLLRIPQFRCPNLASVPVVSLLDCVFQIGNVDRVCDLDLAEDFPQNSQSGAALKAESSYGNNINESDTDVSENGVLDDAISDVVSFSKIHASDSSKHGKGTIRGKFEFVDSGTVEQIDSDTNVSIQTAATELEVGKSRVSQTAEGSAEEGHLIGKTLDVSRVRSAGLTSTHKSDTTGVNSDPLEDQSFSSPSEKQMQTNGSHNLESKEVEGGTLELVDADADANSSIQEDSLRFEVSQYTGRIHLYVCISGKDSRPRPLFENFRPEELEFVDFSSSDLKYNRTTKFMHENPGCLDICKAFIKEWNDLRPIERNKLLGKPLQLPLHLELFYLKETINHECGGLLKGGSKRRVTPLCEISNPLPPNAVWKKISLLSGCSRKEKEYTQAWTMTEEPLCKLCQRPCEGKLAKAPEFFEDLFCDLSCFEEYRIRTSQRSLRAALFQIEHGVCALCKLDCHKLVESIRPLSITRRREYIEKAAPKLANLANL